MLLFRKSDFLQSRIVTRRFFLGIKLFCLWSELAEILWGFMKSQIMNPHKISAHSDNFYFWHPMLLIELISISNMGVSLIETCFCSRLYGIWYCTTYSKFSLLEAQGLMLQQFWFLEEKMYCGFQKNWNILLSTN